MSLMSNIPFFMVVIFLLLTLATGIYYSYNKKSTTIREYAIGYKTFSTTTLVATVLATTYGGGTLIRAVEQVYSSGLYWIMLMILAGLNLWIVSLIAIRMGPFMEHLSLPETIGSIYGQYARIITGISSVCSAIAVIAIQINVISVTISSIFPYNSYIITVLTTLILIFYSTLGGIRSVTFTDVLQFITFTIIIPLVAWFMFINTEKSFLEIIYFLKDQEKFQFNKLFQCNTKLISLLFLLLSYLIGYTKEPTIMQRIYMSSDPTQAYKVFKISTICHYLIKVLIILISLFVFVKEPHLPINKIWNYIPTHVPPVLNGFIAISLLAMTMSTADSHINNCAVIVSYDILEKIIPNKLRPINHLKLVKWSSLIVGLLAMMLTFYCNSLLTLLKYSLNFSIPITVAPFLLAVFGFRGTSRTALIGMGTGVLTILAWNKCVEPRTGIDGSFISMLANGLAMMAAHYFLKQPKSAGWVGPDDTLKQIQQEKARRKAERKESAINAWANRKVTLAKLMPSHTTMVCVGFYIAITTLIVYFVERIMHHNSIWLILQLFGSACCIGYPFLYDASKKIRAISKWVIGLCWITGIAIFLPFYLIWYWWYVVDPIFTTSLFLTDCTVILWVLPLYLGIGVIATTILLSIYPIVIGWSLFSSLLPLFIAILLIFVVIICFKIKQGGHKTRILYFENQDQIRETQQLKASLYDEAAVPTISSSKAKCYGTILNQVVRKVEESVSFLDRDTPLYKQDIQSIINKFYDWVDYFNRREKGKNHALIQPTNITFDKLIRKVELALTQEVINPPRILVEKTNDFSGTLSIHIICDINQIIYLLVQSVLRVGKIGGSSTPIVRIQLHATTLKFMKADPIDNSYPTFMDFKATAIVVSHVTVDAKGLPEVKKVYDDLMNYMGTKGKQESSPSIDLQMQTISTIIGAHFGYLEAPDDASKKAMLLVLPNKVTDILSRMTTKLPIDALTTGAPVTPKEQADSMMELMQLGY